jgi:ATP-binding protein involved in chromosome partitioning
MPPGTGDVQLSLAQLVPVQGAVLVTTPQNVAVADVRRALRMFETVAVPVLGIVENMSYFVAPDTGTEEVARQVSIEAMKPELVVLGKGQ